MQSVEEGRLRLQGLGAGAAAPEDSSAKCAYPAANQVGISHMPQQLLTNLEVHDARKVDIAGRQGHTVRF